MLLLDEESVIETLDNRPIMPPVASFMHLCHFTALNRRTPQVQSIHRFKLLRVYMGLSRKEEPRTHGNDATCEVWIVDIGWFQDL